MMRILRLLIGLLAVIAIVAFAVANRTPVEVSFAPLPLAMELPLYGVFLAGLVLGVLIGGFGVWMSALRRRWENRRMRNKVWALENQLNVIRQQGERAEAERYGGARAIPAPG
jgi:uncharacterized integral membrane protein